MLLQEMTWPKVAELSRDIPVVMPVAALEQHGHHMPLFTDSLLLGEVARRAEAQLADRALFAPVMWLGNSHHHLDFQGTLTAAPRTYLDLLGGLVQNFVTHGFRRILLINGHGGNIVPGQQTIFEMRQQYRERSDLLLLFASYWALGTRLQDLGQNFQQTQMGHACECETSMMLRLAPHLVQGDTAVLNDVGFGAAFEPAYRGWITRDRTVSGHIGTPRHATAEKGEVLFEAFSRDLVALVDRMQTWNGKSWDG